MSELQQHDWSQLERSVQAALNEIVPYAWIVSGLAFLTVATIYAPVLVMTNIYPAWYLISPLATLAAIASCSIGIRKIRQRRRPQLPSIREERELLSAIRNNGGTISPAEAAINTSLSTREADRILSELAAGGYLLVESRNGLLFYALPTRENPELVGGKEI